MINLLLGHWIILRLDATNGTRIFDPQHQPFVETENIDRIGGDLKEVNCDVLGNDKFYGLTPQGHDHSLPGGKGGGAQQRSPGSQKGDHPILRQHQGHTVGSLESPEELLSSDQGKGTVMAILLKLADGFRNLSNQVVPQRGIGIHPIRAFNFAPPPEVGAVSDTVAEG
jgi:hypothetical protein